MGSRASATNGSRDGAAAEARGQTPELEESGGSGAAVPGAEGTASAASSERSERVPGAEGTAAPLEVTVRRRHFSAAYKRKIVAEADKAAETPGAVAALLRREGLYSSHLTEWRKAMKAGQLQAGKEPRRGRPSKDGLTAAERRLERENARLRERLRQAELIIDVQKKLSALLGTTPPSEPSE
jgi:transposase-like protein